MLQFDAASSTRGGREVLVREGPEMKSWNWAACGLFCISALLFSTGQRSIQDASAAPTIGPESCGDLAHLALPNTKITSAKFVPAGDFRLPDTDPAKTLVVSDFCRVEGLIAPTIKFEVWLPPKDKWNGRFQMFGGGAAAGYIAYGQMGEAVNSNYATAATDTGHVESDLTWMRIHGRVVDYAYRAIHLTAVRAQTIVSNFYHSPAQASYFVSCSNGGRQGLMEAQRYPKDFDGIVANAPIYDFTGMLASQLWFLHSSYVGHRGGLSAQQLKLVQDAALAACDELDGVKDGVIEDPRECKFDPKVLQCSAGQTNNCLTSDQVEAIREIYSGPHDPRTGKAIIAGFLPGAEGGWARFTASDELNPIVSTIFRSMVFQNPNWDWHTFDFGSDQDRTEQVLSKMFDAIDPDLKTFKDRGGKIIIFHGWSDPIVPPLMTIKYYEQVGAAMRTDPSDFFRLFLVPGMLHCGGGAGTDRFDAIGTLDSWVSRKQAPDRIVASHYANGDVVRTRALCPYPQVSRWDGVGSTDAATSFICRARTTGSHSSGQ